MTPRRLLRSIARSPGLLAITTATIALGVGALTTIVGVADAALCREPPFPNAGRLVVLFTTFRSDVEPLHQERWSYPRIRRLRAEIRTVPRIANFSPTSVSLTGTDLTEPLRAEVVSPEYFEILGVPAALGRGFAAAEDAPGATPVAVLGDRLWRRRFGADSAAIGRTIEINRQPLTIVGIMPPGFRGLSDQADLWFPTGMAPAISYGEYLTTNQNFISIVARLTSRADLDALRGELGTLAPGLARAFPSDDDDEPGTVVGATARPLDEARITPDLRRAVELLLAGVVVLHLLASVNAASLLLGRAITLRREAAIRASLGADEATLLRHYLVQTAAPVGLGALGGLLIAWKARGLVVPLNAWGARSFFGSLAAFSDPAFGWRTVAAWAVIAGLTLGIAAWGPALATVRGDLTRDLRQGARAGRAGGLSLRRPSARALIVTLEAALAVLLLAIGGLMIDSFARMRGQSIGVVPDHVLTFRLQPSDVEVPPTQAPAFIGRALAAIDAVPGVLSASVDGGAPLAGSASSTLRIVGRPDPGPGQAPEVLRHYVGPDHFQTLGIPLLRGRVFTDRDRAGQPPVAVISESAARRFWPGADPIGERVWFGSSAFESPENAAEIVGVVGDVQYRPLDQAPNPASFYTPYRQFSYSGRTYFVLTAGDPMALAPNLRDALHAVAADVPMAEVRPLTEVIEGSWSRNRFDAWFFGGFALIAMTLAATGIYAVVAYAVGQRDREMAIRLAVGASPPAVFGLVVREGMAFPLIGLGLGALATLAAARLLRGAVYGVAPDDPRVLAAAAAALAAVALGACVIPARRAMGVEPQAVLRGE